MSKQYLKNIFDKLTECNAWSLQIVQVKNSNKSGTSYICREVATEPVDKLLEFVGEIQNHYCSDEGIESFASVDDYTGDVVSHVIYKLEKDNQLISSEFERFIQSVARPDREMNISDLKPNAAVFKGTVSMEHGDIPVLLISMQKPISTLSNKLLWIDTNKFRKINEPVLTIRKTIDMAIIGSKVYLFTLAGEKLFDMERTYKTVCRTMVDEIVKCDFLTDRDSFALIANSGRNPRRFVSYNKKHFDWLKNETNREKAAIKFGLTLEGSLINTADELSVEKLVKFLCNKAMVDPCDESPVEVAATKPWS